MTMVLRYVALTGIAGCLVLLFSSLVSVNQTTVALAFLVLVLVTAYHWRLSYSVYVSLLCTLLYNFFFLPPIGRFTIAAPQNWIAFGAFLFTSVLVSHLSNRERSQAEASEARRRDVEFLYRLSQRLLVQEELRELASSTPSVIAAVFGVRAVALYVAATDTVFYSDPHQILLSIAELRGMQAGSSDAVLVKDGVTLIPLRMGVQHPLGMLAMAGGEIAKPVHEAIGSLVSVALERAAALERSSRLEAARESERLRSALVDSVTHDLRTPLTVIRAAATTLLSEPEMATAERNDLISVIDEESDRLDRLIGQAVEMARLDSHSLKLNLHPQDVAELIEMALENMQPILRSHVLQVQIAPNLPRVHMDRILIERVLHHLLENAARYSPPGTAVAIAAQMEQGRLLFTISDHGSGIDSNEIPFIFDKYFRGKTPAAVTRGTGMGLAIAKAIVEAHGGAITAESSLGQGARFHFWIPDHSCPK